MNIDKYIQIMLTVSKSLYNFTLHRNWLYHVKLVSATALGNNRGRSCYIDQVYMKNA
jgi:hypothetical protein